MKSIFKQVFITVFLGLIITNTSIAQVWQWSVPVRSVISNENSMNPEAFLWIPENCKEVKGVILAQHNMLEEGILEDEAFRKSMTKLGFAEIWVSPGFDITFNFNEHAPKVFEDIMNSLAEVSGYQELKNVPVIPIGHSAYASYPWNFAAWNPNKTLAVISLKGDAPQTNLTGSGKPNPNWVNRNIDGVPGLMVMGEYEWWLDRLTPGLNYVEKHLNSPITWYTDAGRGHFDFSNQLIQMLTLYIEKVAKYRLPNASAKNAPIKLNPIKVDEGYLMGIWNKDQSATSKAVKYADFTGEKFNASWVFDLDMANVIEAVYQKSRGKKEVNIGFSQQGKVLIPQKSHANYSLKFTPKQDGITFNLSAFFSDTSKIVVNPNSPKTKISIDKICGPVKKINDTTFQIAPYRIGFNSAKRSNDIWLLASNDGDEIYKSTVQQANLRFPIRNEQGKVQRIEFYNIKDQKIGTKRVRLYAVSDAALKVGFYVKEGPAILDNNELILTKIPPSAKFPVKVTVVAWQYGVSEGNQVQSAYPIERSFYITKK
jgi:hypothetical protein